MGSREGVVLPECTCICGHVHKFEESIGGFCRPVRSPDPHVTVSSGGSPPTWVLTPGGPESFTRNPIDPSLTTSGSIVRH